MIRNITPLSTRWRRSAVVALGAAVIFSGSTPAVSAQTLPPPLRTAELAGPRFGITALGPGVVDALAKREISVKPTIVQFGWQFERQFYSKDGGVSALNEWVVLLGGLEQGLVLPSVSWLVGIRTREGTEIGVGPNVTRAGVALAIAAGITVRAGGINVPLNVAVVPSKVGTRVSALTGFTLRR